MVLIRSYRDSDLEGLAALMTDLGYPVEPARMKERMDRILAEPSCHTFVAVRNDRVFGMIGCREAIGYEFDGTSMQINSLVVAQSAQGQGIGRALMEYAESWAAGRGANTLFLTSGNKPEREEAHRFYERRGFTMNGYRFVKRL